MAIADLHRHPYIKDVYPRRVHLGDRWASEAELGQREAFNERCRDLIAQAVAEDRDIAYADVTPRDDFWTPMYDLWASILNAHDVDEISTVGSSYYNDTGENWPLVNGYGSLVEAHFAALPVALNTRAERVHWSGGAISVTTPKGVIEAARAIVTVSTGVLAAEDILFEPRLPDWKLAAIAALPLGSHNRIGIGFDRDVFGPDQRGGFLVYGATPESLSFQIRPFDRDHAVGIVGGRFGKWLERSGPQAMADFAIEKLKGVYGTDIARHVTTTTCSAWDSDPLVRGAYSGTLPGHAGARRADLAAAVDERLFFAGEATSPEFFATCHGAYISGIAAAREVATSLGAPASETRRGVA